MSTFISKGLQLGFGLGLGFAGSVYGFFIGAPWSDLDAWVDADEWID